MTFTSKKAAAALKREAAKRALRDSSILQSGDAACNEASALEISARAAASEALRGLKNVDHVGCQVDSKKKPRPSARLSNLNAANEEGINPLKRLHTNSTGRKKKASPSLRPSATSNISDVIPKKKQKTEMSKQEVFAEKNRQARSKHYAKINTESKDDPNYWCNLAVENLLTETSFMDTNYTVPTHPYDFEYHRGIAIQVRKYLKENNKEGCCCVCSRRRRRCELHLYDLNTIPNLDLLSVEGVKTPVFPRDCKTIWNGYCLQKLGMVIPKVGSTSQVKGWVCEECYLSLERKKVPIGSLVRVDTGNFHDIDLSNIPGIPRSLSLQYLKPLTLFEESLVSFKRGLRHIYTMKASGDTGQWSFRGHVIAIQNVDIQDVIDCFPMTFEEIPKNMQAIFINMATDKQDLEAMINKAKAFQIDGRNVAMWARYLAHVYKDYIGEKMDGQLISKYEGLKSMPKSFVDAALIARNAEDADDLAKAAVQEIIQEKNAEAYGGQVAPHYLTKFMEDGKLIQEWLEEKELPVKMLKEFKERQKQLEDEEDKEVQVLQSIQAASRKRRAPQVIPVSEEDKSEEDGGDEKEEGPFETEEEEEEAEEIEESDEEESDDQSDSDDEEDSQSDDDDMEESSDIEEIDDSSQSNNESSDSE